MPLYINPLLLGKLISIFIHLCVYSKYRKNTVKKKPFYKPTPSKKINFRPDRKTFLSAVSFPPLAKIEDFIFLLFVSFNLGVYRYTVTGICIYRFIYLTVYMLDDISILGPLSVGFHSV